MLLSTSGSTGRPSSSGCPAENLAANAEQIAQYLDVRADDCAALTLPLTYCYGLSVLHTHLARGAGVLLTELSVVDECFWAPVRAGWRDDVHGVRRCSSCSNAAASPTATCPGCGISPEAGGRMEPDRVRYWATLGRERGWDLFVMYGQCEATARIAYLPPHLAAEHPGTVGVPVPGGAISLDDGEIVFSGPNVMLGYAHEPADLALGRTTDVLRTGDLGRLTPEGLLQVVGRRARFVKVLGHRVDLDTLERRLRAGGHDVRCAGRDGRVVVSARAAHSAPARESVRREAVATCGAPPYAVRVVTVDEHPTLSSGKPDYPAILRLDGPASTGATPPGGHTPSSGTSVARLYAVLLHQAVVADDATFAGLGGDSLSYVEVSIRLEELLGHLPTSWHITPVGELERLRSTAVPPTSSSTSARAGDERPAPPGERPARLFGRDSRCATWSPASGSGHWRSSSSSARTPTCSRFRARPTRCSSSPATSWSGSSCPNRTDGPARRGSSARPAGSWLPRWPSSPSPTSWAATTRPATSSWPTGSSASRSSGHPGASGSSRRWCSRSS